MQAKLTITFDHLSESDFLAKSGTIVSAVTTNINFPEPWLPQIASLTVFTTAYKDYETAYHSALNKDIAKVALRQARRLSLTNMLKQLAGYFELVAQGSIAKLQTTGFDLRRDQTHTGGDEPLPAPADFHISRGVLSGTLDVSIAHLDGAGSYEVQLAELDPLIEANWQHILSSTSVRHIQLTNLILQKTYWVRVRGIGSNGAGVWTDPLHIVVL